MLKQTNNLPQPLLRQKTFQLINFLLYSLIFLGLPAFAAAQEQSRPAPSFSETQLEILRRPLNFSSTLLYWGQSRAVHGGPLRTVVRMNGQGLADRGEGAHELSSFQETLLLQSDNKTRCYIPLKVINDLGFATVEEFRVYLFENDIYIVECIVDIDEKINLAKAVSLYFNFIQRDKPPEVKLEVKTNEPSKRSTKPSRGERALP